VFDVQRGSIYTYVKSPEVYICASDPVGEDTGLSYAVNACTTFQERDATSGARPTPIPGWNRGKKLSAIRNPTAMMMLGEEARPTGPTQPTEDQSTDDGFFNLRRNPDPADYANFFAPRHTDGGNILFVDGHVKWMSITQAQQANVQIGNPTGNVANGCEQAAPPAAPLPVPPAP
jgi:prepilin-type processing-associated H-X9-DG protein